MLRALQLGLSIADMQDLTIGMVFDMMTEASNDTYEYPYIATQEDFDNF